MSYPQQPQGPQPTAGGASLWGSQTAPQPQPLPQLRPPAAEPSWGLDAAFPAMPPAAPPQRPMPRPEPPAGLGAGFWPGAAAGAGTTLLGTGFVALIVWASSAPPRGTKSDPLPAPTNMLAALQAIKERTDRGLPPPVFAPPAAAAPKPAPPEVDWSAVGESATAGKVTVSIDERWRGEPPMKSLTGGKPPAVGERLILRVKIANGNPTRKIEFNTWGAWSGSLLSDREAQLVDEHGNTYRLTKAPFGQHWIGHALLEPIAPDASHVDHLVFEAPIAAAQELRLTLPGKNVGEAGELRLKIPVASVRPLAEAAMKNP